jgi:hypothetical protein
MKIRVMEHYPEKIQARLESRDRKLKKLAGRTINGKQFELVIEDLKVWRVGTLKISFKGGTPALHKKIATVATLWTKEANIVFDFGYNSKTKKYRQWRKKDKSHIRIGFNDDGYWSLVGTDSNDPNVVDPGDISMNFQEFDKKLPGDWRGTVLHEFGHALGFHHEHSSPEHQCDFDWPRLYEYLAGSPNFWSKRTVDHNLRQLPAQGMTFSKHDPDSIMHYSFSDWMFVKGVQSKCYVAPNHTLSASDKMMARKAYPRRREDFAISDERRKSALVSLLAETGLPAEIRKTHKAHFNFLKTSKEHSRFLS